MGARKKGLRALEPRGRRVLVRVDFNVPLRDGEIRDDTRITAALPSLRDLRGRGARIVLMSHLGRPKGKRAPEFSLRPVAARLAELLGAPVAFADDCVGPAAEEAARRLADGEVLLLENLRFHPEEEKNDPGFAGRLARLGEMYVNDAFGSAHRAHASTEAVARRLHPAVAGLLMERELEYLGRALEQPQRPFVAILGGAKISGKIEVIEALLGRVDRLLVGGAMMFTFLRARGRATGRSLVEEEHVGTATALLEQATRRGVELVLPVDCIVSTATDGSAPATTASCDALAPDAIGVDIGPESVRLFEAKLRDAKTVFWNGPMGVFEWPRFAEGTKAVAEAVAKVDGYTVVGGADSIRALAELELVDDVDWASTGGGASLELLEGKELPGVMAIPED